MRVSIVQPRDLGKTDIDRWRALQASNPVFDSPFLSPEFTTTVGALQERVRVAVLHDGPDTVGFFPFERHPMGIGMPVAAGLTDAQGLVHAKDVEIDPHWLIKACGLAVFEFDHLAPGQPLLQAGHSRHPSPIIDLRDGFESYIETVKVNSGKTYRSTAYKSRKLQRDVGPVRHEYGIKDLAPLRTLLGWKTEQYRRTGRTDRFARPWIVKLVERLLATDNEHFGGVLDMLYVDDRPVAGHFGLRTGTTLAGWFPAYDTAYAKYSPGLIHHLAMAEKAAATGIQVIDMGRGEKEYKEKLKNGEYEVAEGRVARPSAGAGVHWMLRVPVRKARGTVLAHPMLRTTADRALKTYGRLRTTIMS
ncbi:CelD/BcsL family acetyltransferase involved in cellulose biosynthesis [Streptosporangium becharense]|uniref:CelD/BcsL family acetyltransferase involved in cellulose biosynthesis n=1 Tax=Streptosporangium becharense TaxID=1816182 RepID=A0A7W9MIM5_9ACTN|nr:GNAT family N-acetyltransferase [Streptosporangium becharense]MBB2911156.1 CelD/BcsL family acetyltransferase involved in cellulose biosynthesis [Streptosporangium becharense]MBB5821786.1 CelD/BcsL family acetyltransferase involved in cellulose biosynthesis [Streptosporangium becharense]